jgi:glycosyltransferase involved in cell wall biosynthesis
VRLGVNGWRLHGHRTGIGRYLFNVVRHWTAEAGSGATDRITLYSPRPIDHQDTPLPGNIRERVIGPAWPMLVWENLCLAPAARDDVLFCPSYSRPLCPRARTVVATHEAMLPRYPDLYPLSARIFYRWLYGWSARRATLVITSCEAARQDIARYYRVPLARIRVVYMAPAEVFRPRPDATAVGEARARYARSSAFFLFVGKLLFRDRNVPRLLEAFAALKRQTVLPHRLVIVGLGTQTRLAPVVARLGIAADVIFLDYIPDEDLSLLYNAADAFILPSPIETLSLPVMEAQAAGTPVICADTPGLREITGGAALLMPKMDASAMAEAMVRLAGDSALRRDLAARGRAAVSRFSWRRCAAETLAVLEEAAGLREAPREPDDA